MKRLEQWHLFVLGLSCSAAYFLLGEPLIKNHDSFSRNPIIQQQPAWESMFNTRLPRSAYDYHAVVRQGTSPAKAVTQIVFKQPTSQVADTLRTLAVTPVTGRTDNVFEFWTCKSPFNSPTSWWKNEPRTRSYFGRNSAPSDKVQENVFVATDQNSATETQLSILLFQLE